ncbi:MAG TPA: DUF3300 domain-containing protein [Candidatus Acidoferrum sp.]|nr:DUF3300 domain-containing protein [Candidatus Acidoferrum sp.]
MIAKNIKKIFTVVLSIVFATASSQLLYGYQTPNDAPGTNTGNSTETVPNSTSELQSLVAPIALYPDALVAQILTASTFPDQVAIAEYWLEQNKSLTGSALMQAVDTQSWDASVKALTQFPSVLANLAHNLTWTSSLGEAFHNQQAEVMSAIQTLRAQAKAAGNLKSTPQVTVVQQSPQVIVIQPANPQVVYVPVYNPTVIYGTPYVTPGYSAGDVAAAAVIGFGVGIAVGAMMSGGCCSWGYSSWNCGWHGTAVVYHGGAYYGNTAWHGGYYNGGYHNSYGYNNAYNNAYNHSNYNNSYKNNGNTYNRNVSGNTVNVNNDRSSASNSWAQRSSSGSGRSDAFSGMSGHSGGFGGSSGWSSRAESSRGWGSMRSSGFGGGRFGGGGFGGGGFGGRR